MGALQVWQSLSEALHAYVAERQALT